MAYLYKHESCQYWHRATSVEEAKTISPDSLVLILTNSEGGVVESELYTAIISTACPSTGDHSIAGLDNAIGWWNSEGFKCTFLDVNGIDLLASHAIHHNHHDGTRRIYLCFDNEEDTSMFRFRVLSHESHE